MQCTHVVVGPLGDAVAVHLAVVPGAEQQAGGGQEDGAQPAQLTLWGQRGVAGSVALERPETQYSQYTRTKQ